MKNLNFLPEPYLERIKLNKFIKKAMCLWVIAFLFIILFVIVLNLTVRYHMRASALLDSKLNDPAYTVTDKLAKDKADAEAKLAVRQSLMDNQKWDGLELEDLTRLINTMPDKLYVWEVSLNAEEKRGQLQGVAREQDAIGTWVENLENAGYTEVRLTQMDKGAGGIWEFTVKFAWEYR